jgi:hypothetical protein
MNKQRLSNLYKAFISKQMTQLLSTNTTPTNVDTTFNHTDFCGNVIRQRVSDGFLSATDMCKANNKLYADWYRLDSTKEFVNELSNDIRDITYFIEVNRGGNIAKHKRGSWVHPYVATNLAQWLSPKFAVFVSKLVFRYVSGDTSLIDEIKANNEFYKKQLEEKDRQLTEVKEQLDEKDALLEEKDEQLNRDHILHIELLKYKKRVTKEETVYIVSSKSYARQGIFKIGQTRGQMRLRSSCHNTTHIVGDKVKVLREFKVNDSRLTEKVIHAKLKGLLLEGEKEFFMCPFHLLESLVDLIVNNDDDENQMVNKIIDAVFRLKRNAFVESEWTLGIPENVFKDTLCITSGGETILNVDISKWTNANKQVFISDCLKAYSKQTDDSTIVWKGGLQDFMVDRLNIPMSSFKSSDWRPIVKSVAEKEDVSIKWRTRRGSALMLTM